MTELLASNNDAFNQNEGLYDNGFYHVSVNFELGDDKLNESAYKGSPRCLNVDSAVKELLSFVLIMRSVSLVFLPLGYASIKASANAAI